MSQDVMICVMNSIVVFDDVNVEMQSSESCVKCLDLDAELLNKQNAYNDLSKSYHNLKYIVFLLQFKNNDLKAQLQAKDTTIYKLKEYIKSMRENDKEEKVKHEMDEIKTINIELEHSVAKLLSEIGVNIKILSIEKDLPKINLIQLKRYVKETVENAAQIPISTTVALGMFKLDLDPLAPRLSRLFIWYLGTGCSKHMTGIRSQLINFVSKFLGTVRFGNDQVAKIMGYAKDGLARGIPKLKFQKYHLCSACALGKSKKSSHRPKDESILFRETLYFAYGSLWPDACGEY
ncbi:hypothetical protein Tco_0951902 [Tanacetum coccineum]|uniref:Retrovirus-related Pol polyprotein from transposon TNT 1-94-like beta-barrel domain-containing protein n=1 Tax=Tanacetum coccineum TaxID=301880 RepID=A0ABQ5DXU6_9ASTR